MHAREAAEVAVEENRRLLVQDVPAIIGKGRLQKRLGDEARAGGEVDRFGSRVWDRTRTIFMSAAGIIHHRSTHLPGAEAHQRPLFSRARDRETAV
jgi:hypothetical protein